MSDHGTDATLLAGTQLDHDGAVAPYIIAKNPCLGKGQLIYCHTRSYLGAGSPFPSKDFTIRYPNLSILSQWTDAGCWFIAFLKASSSLNSSLVSSKVPPGMC